MQTWAHGHQPEHSARGTSPHPTAGVASTDTVCSTMSLARPMGETDTHTRASEQPHVSARLGARGLVSRRKSAHHGLEAQSMTSPKKSARLKAAVSRALPYAQRMTER